MQLEGEVPIEKACPDDERAERVRAILSYHERSKHHLNQYAAGPDHLDWANQPDPFRTYTDAPAVDLPLLADALVASYGDLFVPGAVAPRKLGVDTVAILFELSLGLSAWKEYKGARWALRCNPSSGNLHPTEGYAVLPAMRGLEAGVYHYVSRDHRLERRCTFTANAKASWRELLPAHSFLVGLSSVYWREAWKYGVRAFRYCQHDVGHALAAIRYAVAALGWSARLLDAPADTEVDALLGLDRDADVASIDPHDHEHSDALLLVGPSPLLASSIDVASLCSGIWAGKPNPLSSVHGNWELIDQAATASTKPMTQLLPYVDPPPLPPLLARSAHRLDPVPANRLIRQRRSAVAFDGRTSLEVQTFYAMLDHLLPRPGVPPWDMLPWRPHLHCALFVHRVDGLVPGLYLFERDSRSHDDLRTACRSTFLWRRPADCPSHLALYLLAKHDCREVARVVSCHQEIAADGAFSLGMIAEFGPALCADGPWTYRRLFWEAGVLGQVLYLEAEAAGVRATGIGCYFDDAMHQVIGLRDDRFQSLYHFTVGGPVEDPRLRTLLPYAHLVRSPER